MWNKLGKFIDIDPDRLGTGLLVDEFNHKFANSWIYINEVLSKVTKLTVSLDGSPILVYTPIGKGGIQANDVDSLRMFTPKTGLYAKENMLLYLQRLPYRQWTKGFSIENNYKFIILDGGDIRDIEKIKVLIDPKTEYNSESLLFKDKAFLHWKVVGKVHKPNNTIHLFNNHFEKEMKELWKQYKVISDVPNQKNAMEENLIVDF